MTTRTAHQVTISRHPHHSPGHSRADTMIPHDQPDDVPRSLPPDLICLYVFQSERTARRTPGPRATVRSSNPQVWTMEWWRQPDERCITPGMMIFFALRHLPNVAPHCQLNAFPQVMHVYRSRCFPWLTRVSAPCFPRAGLSSLGQQPRDAPV